MWNLPAPPGFRGFDEQRVVRVYQRHLPHWRQAGATYFVTFRLADSLPKCKLRELAAWREEWRRRNPKPWSDASCRELSRGTMRRVEGWLDRGFGRCLLRSAERAEHVAGAIRHFDGHRYELGAYVVMPNHVHALVRPLDEYDDALERILQSWKRHSARRINRGLSESGSLWQDESFDRIVRDEEHLHRALQYIGSNPMRAGPSTQDCPRWVSESWIDAGWQFVDG